MFPLVHEAELAVEKKRVLVDRIPQLSRKAHEIGHRNIFAGVRGKAEEEGFWVLDLLSAVAQFAVKKDSEEALCL